MWRLFFDDLLILIAASVHWREHEPRWHDRTSQLPSTPCPSISRTKLTKIPFFQEDGVTRMLSISAMYLRTNTAGSLFHVLEGWSQGYQALTCVFIINLPCTLVLGNTHCVGLYFNVESNAHPKTTISAPHRHDAGLAFFLTIMSNLYRTAMSARLAKLPATVPGDDGEYEDNEEEETEDSLGSLPGRGLGPPAMSVVSSFHLRAES